MDTRALVNKAKRGDGTAFAKLIEDRRASVYKIAYCYVKNESDAMDIVSEAVYKAFTSLKKLKKPDYFHTWFTKILINCAINHLKRCKQTLPLETAIHNKPSIAEVLDREDILDLYQAIETLDEKHKTIIILKYLDDLTIKQIGEILKMPPGTVKTYLNRALKQLRLELKEV